MKYAQRVIAESDLPGGIVGESSGTAGDFP